MKTGSFACFVVIHQVDWKLDVIDLQRLVDLEALFTFSTFAWILFLSIVCPTDLVFESMIIRHRPLLHRLMRVVIFVLYRRHLFLLLFVLPAVLHIFRTPSSRTSEIRN